MTFKNLQLQTIEIHLDSVFLPDSQGYIAIGTRYQPYTDFELIKPGVSQVSDLVSLGANDQIRIFVRGLTFGDSVKIKDIVVGGITLQHYIYQGRQYIPTFDHFWQPGTDFNFDGVFELDITMPAWRWIMNNIEREIREHRPSVS